MDVLLHIADWSLFLFHTVLVVFNCIGWAWKRTRRWHLATMGVTLTSWLLLGIWFGTGYCICTDLHWRVRESLGQKVTEDTYIQYLVAKLTGWTPDAHLATQAAGVVFVVSAILTIALNLRDWRTNAKGRAARELPVELSR